MNRWQKTGVLLLGCLTLSSAQGEWFGQVGLEQRLFFDSPQFAAQDQHNNSLYLQPQFSSPVGDNGLLDFSAFVRLDSSDENRSHADLRELLYSWSGDSIELKAGVGKVFWGVTEAVHLVDIINQTDTLESLRGDAKLGQPMLALSLERDWGLLDAYLLPGFRKRTFASEKGRLRAELPISEKARYQSSDGAQHLDYALRYATSLDEWEIALSYFNGTDRTPQFLPQFSPTGLSLIPYYAQLQQVGLELQWVQEAWLWKLEAVKRQQNQSDSHASALGFEYSWYGLFESATDLTLISEWLQDSREQSLFGNDLMAGVRLTLNDEASSQLLFLLTHDLDNGEALLTLQGSRRLGEAFTLSLEGSAFINLDKGSPLYSLRRDDVVSAALAWHF
ncbi:MAG: hypothetical protein Q9N68_05915 [Gammaproteobacteria bacterium]|nr:hypothetical protein [Gammaproteobacteria bacterium]